MKNKLSKRVMAGSMAAVLAAVGAGTYGFEQKSMSEVEGRRGRYRALERGSGNCPWRTTTESNEKLTKMNLCM